MPPAGDRTMNVRLTIGFVLAVAAVLANSVVSYRSLHDVAANEQAVIHTHRVLDGLQGTLSLLKDIETGYRGYHITGDERYLEPYSSGATGVATRLVTLKQSIADNPKQQRNMRRLEAQVEQLLQHAERGISIRRDEGLEPSREFIQSGVGKQQMDSVRDVVAEMEDVENRLMQSRSLASKVSFSTAVFTILVAAALSLGMVAAAAVLALRELRASREITRLLQQSQIELEGRVRERTVDLSRSNEALARSNRELEQFASVASHDLQEPLRKIQAFGDRLQSKFAAALGEQGRDYIDRMLYSSARMRALINDLLTFSRIDTRGQKFVPCDLSAIAREVLTDLESRIEETGARVELGHLPVIQADELQMRQLLQNLIGNGLKFHRPDVPPLIEVNGRDVPAPGVADGATRAIEGDSTEPRCEIVVKDNGIGFEEAYLDRIFNVFQRLHSRQEYEGTGMGLAICRKIAERHGGSITARSAPGAGATFIVTLPTHPHENGTAA
jgi:signal transduction histidine kinase